MAPTRHELILMFMLALTANVGTKTAEQIYTEAAALADEYITLS
jgi:hypothetical protein